MNSVDSSGLLLPLKSGAARVSSWGVRCQPNGLPSIDKPVANAWLTITKKPISLPSACFSLFIRPLLDPRAKPR